MNSAEAHQVVIAGAGPTGLTLAGELALAGVDVVIIERRETQELIGQRAGGLHARTIEMLDQRGIADRFLAAGKPAQVAGFAWIRIEISDFPTRHPYGLALIQNDVEQILLGWVEELGATIVRGVDVTSFAQDETSVAVQLSDGTSVLAKFLVGCDGGRSAVRKAAGIDFPGSDPSTSQLIAEVDLASEPEWGLRRDATGIHGLSRLEGGRVRVMVTETGTGRRDDPTIDDLRAALVAVYGSDYGAHSPSYVSRFTDMARQAATYRSGRVILAGDAAHVHYPTGGQGLNIGMQDAFNLGWKLAQVINGISAESLLDTYEAERRPIAARVLSDTLAQVALLRADERSEAARAIFAELLAMDEPRKVIGGRMSGLDVHYDLGEGHPLLGRRMPDLDLATAHGPTRVFEILHRARPALLNFGGAGALDVARPWANRVRLVQAKYDGAWELPVIGAVEAPQAVLVRPDGYVAWVGDGSDRGLSEALRAWFGPR